MKNLQVNIIFKFQKGPIGGGGNQFLKALKKELETRGLYQINPSLANCFIFNSHQNIDKVLSIKMRNQDKIFIHRIDGPTYLTKKSKPKLDFEIYELNRFIADGTIFQSIWSKKENFSYGFIKTSFITVIRNAPNNKIFSSIKSKRRKDWTKEKCNLIATSLSKNLNKGFKLLKFLDDNLNFDEYSMKFIGNSPISFKNIIHIKPVDSGKLANLLRESDIYVSGALHEACSNSLLEALSCGLPCVAIDSGSNAEIIGNGGQIFNTFNECLEKIDLIKEKIEFYKNNIYVPNIEEITNQYINFIKKIQANLIINKHNSKRIRKFEYYKILCDFYLFHILHMKKKSIFKLFKSIIAVKEIILKKT